MDTFEPGGELLFGGTVYTIIARHDGWVSIAGKGQIFRRKVLVVNGREAIRLPWTASNSNNMSPEKCAAREYVDATRAAKPLLTLKADIDALELVIEAALSTTEGTVGDDFDRRDELVSALSRCVALAERMRLELTKIQSET
jgi:hypothetical protein